MFGGRFLWCILMAAGAVGVTSPSSAHASPPPGDQLGCAEQVFDPQSVTGPALATAAAATASRLHADLHVRVEGNLDGDIDGRERQVEQNCPRWTSSTGLRADDLLVVMVSPTEHQTSIYYGDDFYATLITTDPQIQEFVMNPQFKAGDVEQGLIDGLDAIEVAVGGGGVPQSQSPLYGEDDFGDSSSSSSSSASGSSSSFPVGVIVLFIIVVAISVGVSYAQKNGWIETNSSSGYRRSWGSSGSSSSRSFSSSSHHSSSSHSSGGSHHSGGGGHSSSW